MKLFDVLENLGLDETLYELEVNDAFEDIDEDDIEYEEERNFFLEYKKFFKERISEVKFGDEEDELELSTNDKLLLMLIALLYNEEAQASSFYSQDLHTLI